MKTLLLIAAAVVALAYALLGLDYMREASLVSSCLGEGGSFDYVRAACDLEAVHPPASYFGRHAALFLLPLLPLLAVSGYITWRQGLPYWLTVLRGGCPPGKSSRRGAI